MPAWAREYLTFQAWTADELRSLLCGVPPKQPIDEAPRSREETNEAYVRAELKRVAADRHIRDAIATGLLKIIEPPDDSVIEKIRTVVTAEELQRLIRALAHERTCSKSYRVEREAAIRWARSQPDLFPDFPFTANEVGPSVGAAMKNDPLAQRLKAHRRALVRRALNSTDSKLKEFCQDHDISTATVGGMINGDTSRYGDEKKKRVLSLLKISDIEWDSPD